MPIPPPDAARLAALNSHFNFGLSEDDLAEFAPAIEATMAPAAAVAALYDRVAPTAPKRDWWTPDPTENPFGAWYVRTSITGSGEGPLAGREVAIKDNICIAGLPMMNGSDTLEGFVPRRDATVVTRLLDAGATIVGKAVCEDLCFSGGSFTSRTGPVLNPWDTSRNAGGSSSGCAALVAAGEVELSVGGDQGGSVRIPSSFCGTVGFKPTFGLVPYTGAFPIERSIDHLGPMTRTVADAALMLGVLAGPDGFDSRQPGGHAPVDYTAAIAASPKGLRAGVVVEGFGTPVSDPAVDAAVREAAEHLRAIGMSVEDVSIPWHADAMDLWNVIATEGAANQMIEGNAFGMNAWELFDPELMEYYGRQRIERGATLSNTVKLVGMTGRHMISHDGGKHYAMARCLAYDLRAAYDDALSRFDVLVMPTLPYTAVEIPAKDASLADYLATALSMIGNTAPFDVSGHPACSVPAGMAGGLPCGLMLVGRRFDDATVLRVGHHYEQAVGGFALPSAVAAGSA
jgi:amidase